jgi:DNA repair protein RecN (Recombination protein N)
MLSELEIHDFAIVRDARTAFGPGLCALSGETGAGKSLVIDAIAALVGGRVGADAVRSGAEVARLRAVFDLRAAPAAANVVEALGIAPDPDGVCILTREVRRDGRNRCTINGGSATVAMLRQVGEALIDLHGQHEHQSLLRVAEHVRLLDAVAGESVAAAARAWRAGWQRWRETVEAAEALAMDEGERVRRADMLRFQVGEIADARLTAGEEEDLRHELARLEHAEALVQQAALAHEALAGADEGAAATDRLALALDAVTDMAQVDADLAPLADELANALSAAREAARVLARYPDRVEANPHRLDAVQQRLELLRRLQRKYGASVADVLAFGAAAAAELAALETAEERLAGVVAARAQAEAELAVVGATLTRARTVAAQTLAAGVESHLRDLNLDGVRFVVSLEPRPAPGPDGCDQVEFLFSANPGEPPRALGRIASGGEISRVMLALKSQLAARDDVPTMIFDEIDVGIGGVTIRSVARKMAAIAAHRQVIVVTHHAPIAALADTHLAVEKEPGDDATRLSVAALDGDGRVHELARMLGRRPPTEATLAMARELLAEPGRP